MKNPKLFLGFTIFCLAAVGIVAAKSNKGAGPGFYYTAAGVSHCKAVMTPCINTPTAMVTCKTVTNAAKPYFTNNICTKPIRYTKL